MWENGSNFFRFGNGTVEHRYFAEMMLVQKFGDQCVGLASSHNQDTRLLGQVITHHFLDRQRSYRNWLIADAGIGVDRFGNSYGLIHCHAQVVADEAPFFTLVVSVAELAQNLALANHHRIH